MKKILILIMTLILGIQTLSAQTYRYKAAYYAFGERTYSGKIVWGKWQRSNVIITIDFDDDYIKVYSSRNQDYVIIEYGDTYKDEDEANNVNMVALDEEGIECNMRLRVQKDGVAQMYSYYSDCAWVYSDLKRY